MRTISYGCSLLALAALHTAQVRVAGAHEIDDVEPAFAGALADQDWFGTALTSLSDLDGNGRDELAVGARGADFGGTNAGVVYLLSLETDGTVGDVQMIGENLSGFNVLLDPNDNFGESVTAIADMDGDGREELVVGMPGDDDGGSDQGAVWVLFPNANGTIHAKQKISKTVGGFTGPLCCGQVRFGKSVARIGDLDGDGLDEVAVSSDTEQIFVLYLNANGTVRSNPSIARPSGSFNQDGLGGSLAGPGDLDLDGIPDLLVGADRTSRRSAMYSMRLAANGSVLATTKVSWSAGGFAGVTAERAPLACSLAPLGDIDGDGELDFAMGTCEPNAWCFPVAEFFFCTDKSGSAWIGGLHADGTVGDERRITDGSGGIGPLDTVDGFGTAVTPVGDLDGNGTVDLAIGAPFDDGMGIDRGSVWIAFLEPATEHAPAPRWLAGPPAPRSSAPSRAPMELGNHARGFSDTLHAYSLAGASLAAIGDLDDDGHVDLALGTPGADIGATVQAGAFRILFLDGRGAVRTQVEIPAGQFGIGFADSTFGWSLAALGDHDGDGVEDLAVGCPELNRAWVVFMNADGSVASSVRISDALPDPYFGSLYNSYGAGLAGLGDVDGDGIGDLALLDAAGPKGETANVLYIMLLNANGTVKGYASHMFGTGLSYTNSISCASVGDLDGNGRNEVAVGNSLARHVRVHFLNANGTVQSSSLIPGPANSRFGSAVAGVGDLDGDGIEDLAVGAPSTNGFRGAYWIVFLLANGNQKSSLQFQGPAGHAEYLDIGDMLGSALAFLGDHDCDLVPSLVVGASGSDVLNTDSGSAWIVDLP